MKVTNAIVTDLEDSDGDYNPVTERKKTTQKKKKNNKNEKRESKERK